MDWSNFNNEIFLKQLGERIRRHRMQRNLTQKELAEKSGISIFTIAQMEKGNSVSMSMFVDVLRAMKLLNNFEYLLPEVGISPADLIRLGSKVPKRIKHKK